MTSTTAAEAFAHPALLYRDDEEYLTGTVPSSAKAWPPVNRSRWPFPAPTGA
jgi:hypothetical protein